MAATATRKSKEKRKDLGSEIRNAYIKYRLENGSTPPSIYSFAMNELKIEESEFYNYYNSFDGIEQDIWNHYFHETMAKLENDETYISYSVSEKLLAFFFTLFELMKANRSFIILSVAERKKNEIMPQFLTTFYEQYSEYVKDLVAEGSESGEIASRPEQIKSNYYRAVWAQFIFLLDFWIKDTSKGFEDTDAAIEKSVNLLFDLIGKNLIDNVFDFAKFLIGRR